MNLEQQAPAKSEQPNLAYRLTDEALTFLMGTGLSEQTYSSDPAKAVAANATEKMQLEAAHQIIDFTDKNAAKISTNGILSLDKIKTMEESPDTSAADKAALGALDRNFSQLQDMQNFDPNASHKKPPASVDDFKSLLTVSKAYEQDRISKEQAWSNYLEWGAMGHVVVDGFPLGISTAVGGLVGGPIGAGVGAAIGLGADGFLEYENWKTNYAAVPNYYDRQRQTSQSIVSDYLSAKRP